MYYMILHASFTPKRQLLELWKIQRCAFFSEIHCEFYWKAIKGKFSPLLAFFYGVHVDFINWGENLNLGDARFL